MLGDTSLLHYAAKLSGSKDHWTINSHFAFEGCTRTSRPRKAPQRSVEELLRHLVADDSLPAGHRPSNQFRRLSSLRRSAPVERIDKEVRVEEKPTVHSSRPG